MNDPLVVAHVDAFISSFVLSHRRERYLLRKAECIERLCHQIQEMLDLRYAIRVPIECPDARLVRVMAAESHRDRALYVSAWSKQPVGDVTLDDAVSEANSFGGALVSVLPGELVYVCAEHASDSADQFVLAKDPVVRARLARLLKHAGD